MLKRNFILLLLAGGMLLGTSIPSHSHARTSTTTCLDNSPGIDVATVKAILKLAAPQLGLSFPDAWTAYLKGQLTITELPNNGAAGSLYDVQFDGGCIWILIADDL